MFFVMGSISWLSGSVVWWVIALIFGYERPFEEFIGIMGMTIGAIMMVLWIPVINILVNLYWLYLNYLVITLTMKKKK